MNLHLKQNNTQCSNTISHLKIKISVYQNTPFQYNKCHKKHVLSQLKQKRLKTVILVEQTVKLKMKEKELKTNFEASTQKRVW